MKSLWTDSVTLRNFNRLEGDAKTDALIVGGGIAGVLCAYFLKKAGVDYILAEGKRIGSGITKNTTAKITSQHGLIYNKLISNAGLEKAKMYLNINELALSNFKELAREIPCGFEEKNAYVYSLRDRSVIEKEVVSVNKLGFKAEYAPNLPLPFKTAGAIKFKNQAQFNPLEFLNGISGGLNIFENTYIREFKGRNEVLTDNGSITAEKIIIATHFPFINKHGGYFIKMFQHRSYVIALENAACVDGMYLEETEDGFSFRNYKDLLLIGGGDHRTGEKGGNWRVLRELTEKKYPNAVEKYAWATQDCMTLDSVPYIGCYSKSTPNMYVATGFNKWGMTSSMAAAMILTDMITGKPNIYAEVFSPQRSSLKPQLLNNGFKAAANLLSLSAKRCPHLGCALKWNKEEHTWDCPCHGSRFEKSGELIDNPALGNLN